MKIVEISNLGVKNTIYFDSSIILSKLLNEKKIDVFDQNGVWVTSDLTELECRRTLDRIRLVEKWSDEDVSNKISELLLILKVFKIIHINLSDKCCQSPLSNCS